MKIVEKAKTITIGGPKIKLPKKGYTKIELKNVYTGEKQVYEDENMMTNAIEKYFANFGLMNRINDSIMSTDSYEGFLGGIALFDNTLEEDADNLFPYGATMTANGTLNMSNAGNPLELGTYNPLKSGWIDGKWVQTYDWNQDHGNGTIASASLVSRYMGFFGFGNKSNNRVQNSNYSMNDSWYSGYDRYETCWNKYALRMDSNGLFHAIPKGVFKNGTSENIQKTIVESSLHEINIQNSTKVLQTSTYPEHNIWLPTADSYRMTVAGGKMYSFRHDGNKWTSSNQLVVVVFDDDHINEYRIDPPEDNIYCDPFHCIFRVSNDGHVFIHKCTQDRYTRTTTVYKIKVTDGTLVSTLALSNTWRDYNPTSNFIKVAEDVYMSTDRIVNLRDDICLPVNGYGIPGVTKEGAFDLLKEDNPLFGIRMYCNNGSGFLNYDIRYKGFRNFCYLASINNLATPVTKTSDKTMTVSYAVTFD